MWYACPLNLPYMYRNLFTGWSVIGAQLSCLEINLNYLLYSIEMRVLALAFRLWKPLKNAQRHTGGNRTMVAAATIVSMAAAKKAQQNVFALYHSYNRTILLEFVWILDFHFMIVLVLRRHYLIPIRCNNGKRKMWPWRWLHHFDFQHWRWLHALMTMVALFRAGNFWHTHSRSHANKYAYRLYDCCQMWYVQDLRLWCPSRRFSKHCGWYW